MSALDDELKELRSRKLKAEFFALLRNSVGEVDASKFKDVEKEVKDEVFAFIDAQVDIIESGEVRHKGELDTLFSESDVKTLKLLINKVQNKTSTETPYDKKTPPKAPPVDMNKQDKIGFAIKHQQLGGKEVKVISMDNATGTVTGLDAPYIGVTLKNGEYVKVLPQDILL